MAGSGRAIEGRATTRLAIAGGVLLGAVNAFPAAEFTARADASHAHFQAALNAAELESYEAASAATDDLFPEPDPSGLYILDLSVAPKARGLGLGAAMMALAEAEARRLKLDHISLDVAEDLDAVGFYKARGFDIAHRSAPSGAARALGIGAHLHMVKDLRKPTPRGAP